jgi:hypothetical protein
MIFFVTRQAVMIRWARLSWIRPLSINYMTMTIKKQFLSVGSQATIILGRQTKQMKHQQFRNQGSIGKDKYKEKQL